MIAALVTAPTASDSITLPLVLTVAIATVVLVGIAVYVRRARRAGTLSGVNAAASGVSAVGVLVSALLVSVAFGGASVASADSPSTPTSTTGVSSQHTSANDLSGYQLPTE